ncbi:MAG: oligosaccharyl transferase, archaeosortase A system-associated [Halanaeroarchaeum sp.]
MSDDAETDADAGGPDTARITALLEDWYQLPVLALLFAFMVWIRQQSWSNFIVDGQVYLGGNDPWYHFRQITYTISHYPSSMPFDVWTNFPLGTHAGQFGTLFDQVLATVALILGAGSPTTHLVKMVALFAPPVIGALGIVPVYFIGKRLGGRITGVLAAVVMALLPGLILSRSLAGSTDHNIAEPLMMGVAVLGLMLAIGSAQRERPVWEQLRELDFQSLRAVLASSTLAAIGVAAYMYVWSPGILLVGIFGAFVLGKMTSDVLSGKSPEHIGIVAGLSMGGSTVLMLATLTTLGFTTTGYSLLQVVFPLAVAVGAAFLAWLAREWEARDIAPSYYAATVVAIVAVGAGFVAVAIPRLYRLVSHNLLRFVGFSAGAATRTIGEAQPFPLSTAQRTGLSQLEVLFHEYGLTFYLAFGMMAILLLAPLLRSRDNRKIALAGTLTAVTAIFLAFPAVPHGIAGIFAVDPTILSIAIVGGLVALTILVGDYDGERLFVVVWTIFIMSAAFTQVRFNYYLALPVAILSAYVPKYVFDRIGYTVDVDAIRDVDTSALLTVAIVLLVLVVPLAVPVGLTTAQGQTYQKQTAWNVAQGNGPGAVVTWDDTLSWMQTNTPAEGNYGGADNADQMQYYGTYHQTDDFDYPAGAYGVMSWWDYGHWITVLGHRIPVANPFQQHATTAANYLIAPNETAANGVLETLDENDAKTRYVAIDWQMVNGKFNAPVTFYDANDSLSTADFSKRIYQVDKQGNVQPYGQIRTQRYYDSMMLRLYAFRGSAADPAPIVVDWAVQRVQTSQGPVAIRTVPQDGQLIKRNFNTTAEARAYVQQDGTAQLGGFANLPSERVSALQHYRLVKVNHVNTTQGTPPYVKLFERVPGATVQGTGPANTTVTARVPMKIPARNTTFTYKQYAQTDANGEFTMTLPYSSTGYENWGVEKGYTNVSVRATSAYQFSTPATTNQSTLTTSRYIATANVTEGQVVGEDDAPVDVTLQQMVIDKPSGANNSTSGQNASSPTNATTTNSTTNTTSTDTSTNQSSTDANTTSTNTSGLAPIAPVADRGTA